MFINIHIAKNSTLKSEKSMPFFFVCDAAPEIDNSYLAGFIEKGTIGTIEGTGTFLPYLTVGR